METNNGFSIYTGHVWVYEGDGRRIITLSGLPASVLQAAIPIFVTLVGPMFWIVIKYVWYQFSIHRVNEAVHGPLFEQQRNVLIRNSVGDFGTSVDGLKLVFYWRKAISRRRMSGVVLLIATGALYFSAWQIVGVFSSVIWAQTVPGLGLIQSDGCGYANISDESATLEYYRAGLKQTILSETYVSQCYGVNSSGFGACNVYASQALSFTGTDTSCPFTTPDICITTNSTPYLLYTDKIDSHVDLGINAAPNDRVTYEKHTTCSPVHATKFAKILYANETEEVWPPETKLQRFYFGPVIQMSDWTFELADGAASYGFGYEISGQTYNPGYPGDDFLSAWTPDLAFSNRTNADVSVLFFTPNRVLYSAPVYDPMFSTGGIYNTTDGNGDGGNQTLWVTEYLVHVIGCIDQHRICNPNRANSANGCTPLVAYNELASDIFSVGLNPLQLATAQLIVHNLLYTNTFNSVYGRRAAALLAEQTVHELIQTKLLPIDQWRLEVQNWFAVSLAKLQLLIVEYSGGPIDVELLPYIQPPSDAQLAKLCNMQLVQLPSAYVNFNFDIIIIIAAVGIFIIVLGAWFERIGTRALKLLARRSRDGHPDRVANWLRWVRDGPFQLQKRMFEEAGMEGWSRDEHDLPISTAVLPHPRIQRPISTTVLPNPRVQRPQTPPAPPVTRPTSNVPEAMPLIPLVPVPPRVPVGRRSATPTPVGRPMNASNNAITATGEGASSGLLPPLQPTSISSTTHLMATNQYTSSDTATAAGRPSSNASTISLQSDLGNAPLAARPYG